MKEKREGEGEGGEGEEEVRNPSDIHVLVARATKTRQNQVRDIRAFVS